MSKCIFVIQRPNGTLFQRDDAMGVLATDDEAQAIRFADARDDEAARVVAYTAVAEAQERDEEDSYVIERLGGLLAEISVIVKGPEPAGTLWSYHDLPKLVELLKAERDSAPALPDASKVIYVHQTLAPRLLAGESWSTTCYGKAWAEREHDTKDYVAFYAITPPAPQRLAQGEDISIEDAIVALVGALQRGKGWLRDYADAIVRDAIDRTATQPPHQDRGEVDSLSALAELLAMPSGYELAEHLPGIWHFTYPGDDGVLMASGASWNHPAIAATEAWLDAALTEAKRQGPGEAVKWTAAQYVDIANRAQERTGRGIYPSTVEAILEAARLYATQVEAKRQTGEGS